MARSIKPKERRLSKAEVAGERYATDQIQGDYFMDWVREQLLEASHMDPRDVLPLRTKDDALEIAKNMFQQLEWDTKRDLKPSDIGPLIGSTNRESIQEFFKGFRHMLDISRDWIADELLQIEEDRQGQDESWSYDDDSEESKRRRGVTVEAPRKSSRAAYRPSKNWRLHKVDRIVPDAGGANRVEFNDGLSIQVHGGHGRSDLLYAMRPSDMRHEGRSPGPESRREYQYAALKAVLGDKEAKFHLDHDGDVVAVRADGGLTEQRGHVSERAPRHWATRVVITKVGPRTSIAKVYDNNGHLMSGFQTPTDHNYVVKKIEEWFPGVPVEYAEPEARGKPTTGKYQNLRIGTDVKIRHEGQEIWVTIGLKSGSGASVRYRGSTTGLGEVRSIEFTPDKIITMRRQGR